MGIHIPRRPERSHVPDYEGQNEDLHVNVEVYPTLTINVSNHPSSGWSESQRGSDIIIDVPFPQIPPDETPEGIQDIVENTLTSVLELIYDAPAHRSTRVFVAGEQVVSFALVNRLHQEGISVVSATTERIVEERDGKKISVFRFVEWRRFPIFCAILPGDQRIVIRPLATAEQLAEWERQAADWQAEDCAINRKPTTCPDCGIEHESRYSGSRCPKCSALVRARMEGFRV